MKLTQPEIQTALAMARLRPSPTSPLAAIAPAMDSAGSQGLRAKGLLDPRGTLTPEWFVTFGTLATPQLQATVYVEGAGATRYFGSGAAAAMARPDADGQEIAGGFSLNEMVDAAERLIGWRGVPDLPPLRVSFSNEEWSSVAALADAHREEQLRSFLERRAAVGNRFSREAAVRQLDNARAHPDPRWLAPVLSRFGPAEAAPSVALLDAGARGLIARRLAAPLDNGLALSPELETICAGFGNLLPFLALASGPVWVPPSILLVTQGMPSFWAIEFGPTITVSRLGGRGLEKLIRDQLEDLVPAVAAATASAAPPSEPPPPLPPPPKPPPSMPPPPAAAGPRRCSRCGTEVGAKRMFCGKCGTPVA